MIWQQTQTRSCLASLNLFYRRSLDRITCQVIGERPFADEEVASALRSLVSHNSCDSDGIHPKVLKELAQKLHPRQRDCPVGAGQVM